MGSAFRGNTHRYRAMERQCIVLKDLAGNDMAAKLLLKLANDFHQLAEVEAKGDFDAMAQLASRNLLLRLSP